MDSHHLLPDNTDLIQGIMDFREKAVTKNEHEKLHFVDVNLEDDVLSFQWTDDTLNVEEVKDSPYMTKSKNEVKNIILQKGSYTTQIYQHIVRKRAVTIPELEVVFEDSSLKKQHYPKYLQLLLEKGLIIQKKGTQSPNKKCSRLTVYGVDEEAIEEKAYGITSNIGKTDLLVGLKKYLFDILQILRKDIQLLRLCMS